MLIGIKIQSEDYWKSTWAFMKMFKQGMENTYDTSFDMEINQQILADQFNKMIPDMYAMIQWGINNEENVERENNKFIPSGDNGELVETEPEPIRYKRLPDEKLFIDTSDILIDQEVIDYMKAHEVKTPNGGFTNVECDNTFFVYDTVSNQLNFY